MDHNVGDLVKVKDEVGTIRFIGSTKFAPGKWYGIELNHPNGKNDGSIQGVKYFECSKEGLYGVFVRESMISVANENWQMKLENLIKENKQYKDKFTKLNDALEMKIKEFHETESRLDMSRIDNEYLQNTKLSLERKVEELSAKYQSLQEEFAVVKEELDISHELERELKNLDVGEFTANEIKEVLEKDKVNEESIRKLKLEIILKSEKIDSLESNLTSYNSTLESSAEKDRTINDLRERIESYSELEKITDRLSMENEELVKTVKKLQKNIDELTELHELNAKIEADSRSNEMDLMQELSALRNSFDENQIKTLNLERQLAESRKRKDDSDNTIKVDQLKMQLKNSEIENSNLEIELSLLKKKLDLQILRTDSKNLSLLDKDYVDLVFDLKFQLLFVSTIVDKIPSSYSSGYNTIKSVIEMIIKLLEYNYNNVNVEFVKTIAMEFRSHIVPLTETLLIKTSQCDQMFEALLEESNSAIKKLADNDKQLNLKSFYLLKQIQSLIDVVLDYAGTAPELPSLHRVLSELNVKLKTEQNFIAVFPYDKYLNLFEFQRLRISNANDQELKTKLNSIENSFENFEIQTQESPNALKSLYDIEILPESSDLNSHEPLLLEKDKEIADLNLNIAILQQNMKLFTKQTKTKIHELETQLAKSMEESKIQLDTINNLTTDNQHLKRELNSIEDQFLFQNKNFDSIEAQKEYNEKMRKFEKLMDLKRKVTTNYVEDLSGLDPIDTSKTWNYVSPLQVLGKDIRKIVEFTTSVKVNPTNDWAHKKVTPRYINACIEEQFEIYKSKKSNLVSCYSSSAST
ncbi:NIP100 [Candida pseudojiufengensis]|uniref:NIP100 n=1 Tax=Candida pseudojiufengensis TaxID=497109 RepID=UPI002224FEB6|nr:NIP100 [Candida pseudojiufengensis]KAI5962149.1 NIP100 [Candida pseudojiufengensis]